MFKNVLRNNDQTNMTYGSVMFGKRSGRIGTAREQVHDGDTIVCHAPDNIGIRFLGIDTAEVSYRFPGTRQFMSLTDARWNEFLADPFGSQWPEFQGEMGDLKQVLQARVQPDAGSNQVWHADRATQYLLQQVEKDMQQMGQDEETFRFFLVFAHEIMDGYGRFLAYINRDQPDRNQPGPRPLTYNERMLQSGLALPYFIWPNINPFKRASSLMTAVVPAGRANEIAESDSALSRARRWVKTARSQHLGVFDAMRPQAWEPFELRLLAGRQAPKRWVIDLSRNDSVLLKPENYHTIPWPEERLFIPEHFVPLFVSQGWKQET